MPLLRHHEKDLKRSGLSDEMIEDMGVESVTGKKIQELTGVSTPHDGYIIPYYDMNGRQTDHYRVRLSGNDKPKYLSPTGSSSSIYNPPRLNELLEKKSSVLVVSEGEKKAVKSVQHGIPCVGIPGVHTWPDPESRKQKKIEGQRLSANTPVNDELLSTINKVRPKFIIVMGDSDLIENKPARKGLELLADALRNQVDYDVHVILMFCPDAGEGKTGLDDWINAKGPEEVRQHLSGKIIEIRDGLKPTTADPNTVSNTPSNDWSAPKYLGVPDDMPVEFIPKFFQDWNLDIADAYSCPKSVPAVLSVLGLSGLVGSRVAVQPFKNISQSFHPNLWGGEINESGTKKSPRLDACLHPVMLVNKKIAKKREKQMAELKSEQDAASSRVADLKEKLQDNPDDEDLIRKLEYYQNKVEVKKRGRYLMVNDVTHEALGDAMTTSPGGILMVRDEIAGMFAAMDKAAGSREFFLETWQGGRSYTTLRIGRGEINIPSMTLSLIGGIQPGKIGAYIESAIDPKSTTSDGFIQRLQLVVVPGEYEYQFWDENDIVNEYINDFYQDIDDLLPVPDHENNIDPTILKLTDNAYVEFKKWMLWWNKQVIAKEPKPHLRSHYSKFISLYLSLATLFYLIRTVSKTNVLGKVDKQDLELAGQWCEYMKQHAVRMYSLSEKGSHADILAQKIKDGKINDGDKVRELVAGKLFGKDVTTEKYYSTDVFDEALKILEKHGWVRMEDRTIRVNPAFFRK